jgi:hypothetical protein
MATKRLRAVAPDERPKAKPASVAEAAETGDHRALLVAMRERIARTVSNPDCPPRDLAALTRRLQDIAKEIEAIDLRRKEDGDGIDFDVEDEALDVQAL